MTRDLNAATQAAASADTIYPVLFAKLEFDGGDVLAHTALGDIAFGGDTYQGIGQFGGMGTASEVCDLSNSPVSLTLSNIPPAMASLLLGEQYQGRRATIYLGYLDPVTNAPVDLPTILYRGLIDTADIQQDQNFTITLMINSRFAAWDKPLVRRYNNADQQARYPGDKGLEFVEQSASRQVFWGGR